MCTMGVNRSTHREVGENMQTHTVRPQVGTEQRELNLQPSHCEAAVPTSAPP